VSREGRIVEHPIMQASDVVACFIGVFLGLVAAAMLVAVVG